MKRLTLRLAGAFLALMMLPAALSAQSDLTEQLREKTREYFQAHRYEDYLAWLNGLRKEKDLSEEQKLSVDYYSALAKSRYLEYLEQNEDWAKYYELYHQLDQEIIAAAEAIVATYPVSDLVVDSQYLAWQARLREDESEAADAAFDKLSALIIDLTTTTGDLTKFRETASALSRRSRNAELNVLFDRFTESIEESADGKESVEMLAELAAGYLDEGNTETAKTIYRHYIELAARRYPKPESLEKIKAVADRFRHKGLKPDLDAVFAEEVYTEIDGYDPGFISGRDSFRRAFNLEVTSDFNRAVQEYRNFLKTSEPGIMSAEANVRLGNIAFYEERDPEAGLVYYEKVISDYPDTIYADFCSYETGVYYQWRDQLEPAREHYNRLADGEGLYAVAARERLEEMQQEESLPSGIIRPLELLFSMEDLSSVIMSLEAIPPRALTGSEVVLSGSAQDFSAGTIQPQFNYEWFRETGTEVPETNATNFTTTYPVPGPKPVCFSIQAMDGEEVICRWPWIHLLRISVPEKQVVSQAVEFKAELLPAFDAEELDWVWKIEGPIKLFNGTREFSRVFESSGIYAGELTLLLDGAVVASRKFEFEITE